MSMQPRPWPDVPELTARMARSSSRQGNLAMRIRDELGEVYADARFAGAFGVRGRPGISPGQLMMASVLQFSENLTDRQAAEAVRDRMTWKYALGLELEDPGFDASVLSEFRSRLVAGDLHLPESQAGRRELMARYGTDGYFLLEQVHGPGAPGWLRELPAIQALRRIWIQQFCREVTGGQQEVRRREKLPGGDGLPPGRDRLISPYDLDARYSIKRETGWGGYKARFTETCDAPETHAGACPEQCPAPAAGPGRGDRPN